MSEKITFKQLVELISSQAEQSHDSTYSFIQELVGIIETGLRSKGSVSISGFGKFELRWMNERTGVNPQTGEEITIPGQNKVVFKPYKSLREHVNRPYAKMEPQILSETPEDDDTGPISPAVFGTKKEGPSKEKPKKEEPEKKKPLEDDSPFGLAPPDDEDPFEEETAKKEKESEKEDDTEDEEELLVERNSPVGFPSLSGSDEDEKDEDFLASVFNLSDEIEDEHEKEKEADDSADTPPLSVASTSVDKKKGIETVKKAGSFNWSYAAAAIVVALVIFIILFLMMRPDPAPEATVLPETTEQELTEPADQAVRVAPEEPDPVIDEEAPPEPEIAPPVTYEHDVASGETLWSIAEAEYGNPYLWPLIFESNPDTITDPNVIVAGSSINIPSIEDPQNLTPEESEMVAEGYYSLYQWSTVNKPDEARNFLWAVGKFSPDVLDKYSGEVDSNHLSFAKRQ